MNYLKKISQSDQLAATLVSIVIIFLIATYLQDIIVPFIIAGLLSFLLDPVCQWLENRGIPRILAIIFAIVLVVALIAGLVYLAYTQIIQLDSLLPLIEEKVNIWVSDFALFLNKNFNIDKNQIILEGQKYISDAVKTGSKFVAIMIGGTSNFFVSFALMPLYIFLMLMYRDFLYSFVFKWLHKTKKFKVADTIMKIKKVIKGYVLGLFLVILIVGTLNTIALTIIGIQNAAFFGFFASALVIIPYIGISIGAALPIIVALVTKDSYLAAVAVAGSFALIQFLEGNFITPMVIGNQVSINSLVAITALLLFAKFWGIGGMILALPLTAITKVIFDSNDKLKAWGYLLGDFTLEKPKKEKKA